ncbi:hypothetical protein [Streptomyces sp. NPDC002550]
MVGGQQAAQRLRLADVQTARGERGVHDFLVQARLAATAAQDESEATAGFGQQVPAVEPAAAAHHEHRRGDVDGRQGDVDDSGIAESTSQAHQAGSEILVGLVDELIAVWDGKPARGYGGTADVVAYAKRTGVPVRVLWPEGASR